MSSEEIFEDAEIDGLEERSWFGSWMRGLLVGLVLTVVGVIALSLSTPLPEHLPGVGKVEIVRNDNRSDKEQGQSESQAVEEAEAKRQGVEAPQTAQQEDAPSEEAGGDQEAASSEDEAHQTVPSDTETQPKPALTETPAPDPNASTTAATDRDQSPESATTDAEAQPVASDAEPEKEEPSDLTTASAPTEPKTTETVTPEATPSESPTTDVGEGETTEAVTSAASEEVTISAGTQSNSPDQPSEDAESGDADADDVSTDDAGADDAAAADAGADDTTPNQNTQTSDATEPELNTDSSTDGEQLAAVDPERPEKPDPLPEINLPGPALNVNARPFDPPEGAALLAVVLRDADNGTIDADTLQLMTMPLTLAIGPGQSSRNLAEQARAAGHEVLAQVPMALSDEAPEGTLAVGQSTKDLSDVSARLMSELDLAIGATAPHEAPLLRDPDGMAAIMDPLAPHGFVWVDPRLGIGSAAKGVADIQEITWGAGDRYVDAPATEDKVYQNLESAAALARRQGTSIVFITASQDALKALVRWGLNRGGRQVWFAPISAVIKKRQAR